MEFTSQDIEYTSQDIEYTSPDIAHCNTKQRFTFHSRRSDSSPVMRTVGIGNRRTT